MPDTLLEKSASIRADFFEKQGELLEKLAKEGQSPEALFIGCADSRVSPDGLLGANPCITSKPIRLCWRRWRPTGWNYTAGFTTCAGG